MLIDTHCHLDLPAFDGERTAVVERARVSGVGRLVNPGVDFNSSRRAILTAAKYAEVYAAVGIHPNSCDELDDEGLSVLRALARQPRVVAIGEIGIDYYWNKFPPEAQRRGFEAQLYLADELNLPVIVHDRQAHDDLLAIIEAFARSRDGNAAIVLHSFSGGLPEAKRALEAGAHLGVTGAVTYPKSHELRRVVEYAPLDRLLIETDAPYLAPQARRGRRNEPAFVRYVAEKLGEVRKVDGEAIHAATTANACALFGWESLG